MSKLKQTINQAISDFDSIEAAIEDAGVDIPVGTDTCEYGAIIRSNLVKAGSGEISESLVATEEEIHEMMMDVFKE